MYAIFQSPTLMSSVLVEGGFATIEAAVEAFKAKNKVAFIEKDPDGFDAYDAITEAGDVYEIKAVK